MLSSCVSQGLPVQKQSVRTFNIERAGGNAGTIYCTLITAKLVHQQLKVPTKPSETTEHEGRC